MKEIIEKIIQSGINAPSGDNSQPWKFKLVDNQILEIFNIPDRDIPLYNYEQFGSMIAHGALVENINIAASQFGFATEINYVPKDKPGCTAVIKFIDDDKNEADPLFRFIKERATNRRLYQNTSFSKEEKKILLSSLGDEQEIFLSLLEEDNLINEISLASTINERVVLETKELHQVFFKHVVWSQKEELIKKTGLFIKTLELAPPQELIFHLYKNWNLANLFNSIGLSKMIAKDNAKLYSKSQALAIFGVKNKNQISYLKTGRIMQRLWLIATSKGISAHPVTGVLFLINSIRGKKADVLNENQKMEIERAYNIINKNVTPGYETTMLLRLGKAKEPSARSSRLNYILE